MADAAQRIEQDGHEEQRVRRWLPGQRRARRPARELSGIDLAEAIISVRDELRTAAATRSPDDPLVFDVGDIRMEFTLELRKENKGNGKVKAFVIEAGADATRSTARTHRLSFTLTPRHTATGEPWQVGNDDLGDTSHFGAR
jgi:hypothetical protein